MSASRRRQYQAESHDVGKAAAERRSTPSGTAITRVAGTTARDFRSVATTKPL